MKAYNDNLELHSYRLDRVVDFAALNQKAYQGKYANASKIPGNYTPYKAVVEHFGEYADKLRQGSLTPQEKGEMMRYLKKLDKQERAKLEKDLGCAL
jgi:hypothetical protein